MRVIDILTSPWAIVPDKLEEICAIYATHLRGDKIDISAVEAKLGRPLNNAEQNYEVVDGVAIISIDGVIAKKMNLFSQISGGASTQLIARDVRQALADPAVHSLLLHIDSPGGTVDGTAELAGLIYGVRGQKPIVTYADGIMASAAYWIGSAADRLYVGSETTVVGSIGVIATHVDISRAQEMRGVKTTEVYAGKYKRIASNYRPLSDEGRRSMQDQVDYLYSLFVGAVSKHRGRDEEAVLQDMADGRMFYGQQAIDAGLVDGASTLDVVIADLGRGKLPAGAQAAGNVVVGLQIEKPLEAWIQEVAIPGIQAALEDNDNRQLLGAGAAPPPSQPEQEEADMNIEDVKAKHPAVAEALLKEGANAERARIEGVLAYSMPGHEKLVNTLAFDGQTSPDSAAAQVVRAEKAARGAALHNIRDDAQIVTTVKPGPANLPTAQDVSHLPVEERCKVKWENDPQVRADFTDLASYTAFTRAQEGGKVKILGSHKRG